MKEWEYKVVDLTKKSGLIKEAIKAPTEDSLNELVKMVGNSLQRYRLKIERC